MDFPIQIHDVWKSYGSVAAVRGLSLHVPPRSVYGFLGPNGAGKSTTIRLVLGLQRPERGKVYLFGQALEANRLALLRRIGSLVESPSLYENLTGRENLEVHRRLLALPRRAIDEALETAGLLAAADRVVRGYSSGMKQRLGLAQALLGDPDLLLLDEPTNGLDPAGIREVRDLIRDLPNRSRATVFLSSHLLAEVEQVATHLAVLSSGELKFEGTREELDAQSRQTIVSRVDQAERARLLLENLGCRVECEGGRIRIFSEEGREPAWINAALVRAGIAVSELGVQHRALEDFFLELTAAPHPAEEVAL
jgi:ABC-2 type transport system ATP-binding protein